MAFLRPFVVSVCGAASLGFGLAAAPGCSSGSGTGFTVVPDASAPGVDGGGAGGVGAPCDATHVCRDGLACTNGACAPGHASADGAPCVISAECKQGDYCGPSRTCVAAGTGADGASCSSDGDCASGLRCDLVGFGAECKPEGTADVGGACKSAADCYGGLVCAAGACAPPPPGGGVVPIGLPTWTGADCPPDDPPPVKPYFHVPRGGGNDGDYFRLPFPNDVRTKAGRPDLSGFPTPGPGPLGFDVVDRYLRDVEQNTDGFSTYPTVTLRFNAGFDFDSMKQSGAVRWIDVTAGAGDDVGWGWSAVTARNAYVCPNSMSIRPPAGQPLTPGHTYAVLLMQGPKAADGSAIVRDADFAALVGAQAPSDATLATAYAAYKPLRDWAASKSVDTSTMLGGAVFTVGHPAALASKLAAAIAALPSAPTATGWVKCGGATPSPCPQADGDRACGGGDPAFDELQALVSLPVFQRGTAPYLTPADGGDIALDAGGNPQVQRTEAVCLSLTIPKGATMPAAGWPLVVYAHGTGGSYRSAITEGIAARLASVDDGAGGHVNLAVLGIDQVEHGPRRGASTESPNTLFYNFANPGAARGNPLQGAADQLSLVRFARAVDLPAASSPTGSEIKFGAIAMWGHSQGATEDGIALPYANDGSAVVGAVLSGEGASLVDALTTKKNPIDVEAALPLVLQDTNVTAAHPVLTILQNAIDAADPLNHAIAIARAPLAAGQAKHVFQPYGLGDTYSPPVTERVFALAAGLGLATPAPSVTTPDDVGGLAPTAVPAGGNVTDGSRQVTAIVREYAPNGYDGHFVSTKEPTAQADVAHFLADALAGKTPMVGR